MQKYSIPVQMSEPVTFAFHGAVVERAELRADMRLLSCRTFDWSEETLENPESATVETTDINFFDSAPFHAELAAGLRVVVTLYTRDQRIPSLVLKPEGETLTWDRDHHTQNVTAYSEQGPRNLTLVYTSQRIGFRT